MGVSFFEYVGCAPPEEPENQNTYGRRPEKVLRRQVFLVFLPVLLFLIAVGSSEKVRVEGVASVRRTFTNRTHSSSTSYLHTGCFLHWASQ